MTNNISDGKTNLQESIKEQHRQGNLHPADLDMLMDSASGKGYGQKRLNPSEQSSLSGEPVEAPVQRSLTGEEENRKIRGHINIVPMVISFALGILVSLFIFQIFPVLSQGTKERETIAPDDIVEIPDPVLKKAIQDALGIGSREITGADAALLTKLEYNGYEKEQIKYITGLSAFTNLTELYFYDNQIRDISTLSGLKNLTKLSLVGNQISDISALSRLKNLTKLSLVGNQISDISALSGLKNLDRLWLSDNPVLENKSREEIMEVLSGTENLTDIDF